MSAKVDLVVPVRWVTLRQLRGIQKQQRRLAWAQAHPKKKRRGGR